MKNTILDLNDILFEQIERLNDDDLTEEQIQKEMKRTDAIYKISMQIIENGKLALKTMEHRDEYSYGYDNGMKQLPDMLASNRKKPKQIMNEPRKGKAG